MNLNNQLPTEYLTALLSKVPDDWRELLHPEFQKDYMLQLAEFLTGELQRGQLVYPKESEIFTAFNLTPFNRVKVVIIGQDPYHGPEQAHGLSFSVPPHIKTPPSLANIYKEIASDLGAPIAQHGHLLSWANQGVLLLNSVLTVAAGQAAAHQKKGWEVFTDKVVDILNERNSPLVFLLWGSHAQKKGAAIDLKKHLVLKAPHPSPLSAYRGFFGCKHFSLTNDFLQSIGRDRIDWALPA